MKEFQAELLSTLFGCEDVKDIMNRGYDKALFLVTKTIDKIMLAGENINQEDLVISKLLRQDIIKYKSLFPHVSAAIQLSDEDGHPSKGDTIKYIHTNSRHKNPLYRVVPIHSVDEIKSLKPEVP
jgi:DNA polymerase elongation subunit (family B)